MARSNFIKQLTELGYEVKERSGDCVSFPYDIPVGKLAGQRIEIGFWITDQFPLTPPSGPHVSPHLLPFNNTPNVPHPNGGIHPSQPIFGAGFGPEWQYWSRPHTGWQSTDHTAKAYMAHIRHLFDTL